MKNFAAKGVTARVLPEKMLRELEKVTNEVLAEESARDPAFKKVLDSQRAFENSYKAWKDKAYMPRNW
jgi:TRAP-type mannitol/chloroaromatic compound transport system substrate-binding protein